MCTRLGCHDVVHNTGVKSTLVRRVRTVTTMTWYYKYVTDRVCYCLWSATAIAKKIKLKGTLMVTGVNTTCCDHLKSI
jgi:hypothetical protein